MTTWTKTERPDKDGSWISFVFQTSLLSLKRKISFNSCKAKQISYDDLQKINPIYLSMFCMPDLFT